MGKVIPVEERRGHQGPMWTPDMAATVGLGAVSSGRFQRLLGAWPRGVAAEWGRPLSPGMRSYKAPGTL